MQLTICEGFNGIYTTRGNFRPRWCFWSDSTTAKRVQFSSSDQVTQHLQNNQGQCEAMGGTGRPVNQSAHEPSVSTR